MRFEGFNIALGTFDERCSEFKTDLATEVAGIAGGAAAAVT
jgi:hypothetical protein